MKAKNTTKKEESAVAEDKMEFMQGDTICTQQQFVEALKTVLERRALVVTEKTADCADVEALRGRFFHVVSILSGMHSTGAVWLTAPEELCRSMAEHGIGRQAKGDPNGLGSVLKALVMEGCHQLAGTLYGRSNRIAMAESCLYRIDIGKWHEMAADGCSARLCVDGKPLIVNLMVASGRD